MLSSQTVDMGIITDIDTTPKRIK